MSIGRADQDARHAFVRASNFLVQQGVGADALREQQPAKLQRSVATPRTRPRYFLPGSIVSSTCLAAPRIAPTPMNSELP